MGAPEDAGRIHAVGGAQVELRADYAGETTVQADAQELGWENAGIGQCFKDKAAESAVDGVLFDGECTETRSIPS